MTPLLRAINRLLTLQGGVGKAVWCDPINGNDANTGAQGNPFRTVQFAIEWLIEHIEPAGNWVTIQMMPGQYEPFQMIGAFNGGILVQGDIVNPRSYLVKNTDGVAVAAAYSGYLVVQGFSVEAAGGDADYTSTGCGLAGENSGIIIYKDMAFGPCSNCQMGAWNAGQVWSWDIINYSILMARQECT